jgi:ribosomal protein L24E
MFTEYSSVFRDILLTLFAMAPYYTAMKALRPTSIREKAKFFAALANLPSLDSVSKSERGKLFVIAQALGYEDCSPDSIVIPDVWAMIERAHPWIRDIITSMLDRGTVEELEAIGGLRILFKYYRRPDGHWGEVYVQDVKDVILCDAQPFFGSQGQLFRRCALPSCGKIFVQSGKRRFCSRKCSIKGFGTKENPARRRYLTEKMREYRAKQRKKAPRQHKRAA